ncbi:Cysteine proteinase inhibitor 4 [Platanthera guangdongensis]|uniref:Cysteine proteinase inhibitor 4 n=1 Tax=Platanthera guangdongensis TaxID=2320717 RepID=A0ABR2LVC0_9ASPA
MASSSPSPAALLILCLFLFIAAAARGSTTAGGRLHDSLNSLKIVGGWTEIPDAGSNKIVRDLGRYSVSEYNRRLAGEAENHLSFSGVVSADRQVVSGVKYRIRVAAVDAETGDRLSFVAVVVVRPWLRQRIVTWTLSPLLQISRCSDSPLFNLPMSKRRLGHDADGMIKQF